MGKKKNKKQRRAPPTADTPGSGGFGGLAAALQASGLSASAPEPEPEIPVLPTREAPPRRPGSEEAEAKARKAKKAAKAAKAAKGPTPPAANATGLLKGKAVVRQERKGRGGKTVTVVDGVAISRVDDLVGLARTMRKAMGTGARVEGGKIVLQGDQRKSAEAWLSKQGASVVIGN
ncbi:MAG: translation initiation factor [Proteobacteria bacterium]|nr:translation initiation factor [Pseudomonadota bacterium]